ncbi:lysophospholipid acyltransferase family protein [Nakamurella aerolata]|uniref:lysophospholipid acyltransferase family protein n=1 Tax=Nakamurella aerolata TaxID=1656892 RepID=UPI001BB231BB
MKIGPWWRRAWYRCRLGAGFAVFWVLGRIPHRVSFELSPSIPRTGPALVVVNHQAVTETLAVARFVVAHRRFPHFLITAGVFRVPLVGAVARAMGQIPVARGTTSARAAVQAAADQLRAGHLVVIYPEGRITREPDQRPGPGKAGAALLAAEFPDVPVIPVGQWGARPGWRAALTRSRVRLCAGPPVELAPAGATAASTADNTAAVMAAITAEVERARGAAFRAS